MTPPPHGRAAVTPYLPHASAHAHSYSRARISYIFIHPNSPQNFSAYPQVSSHGRLTDAAAGACLGRLEIPSLIVELGLAAKHTHVLYTDADVMFARDVTRAAAPSKATSSDLPSSAVCAGKACRAAAASRAGRSERG